MLTIDVLTLFPELITTPLSQSIMGRAADKGLIDVRAHQLRDWHTTSTTVQTITCAVAVRVCS